jgi:hypothetical protein
VTLSGASPPPLRHPPHCDDDVLPATNSGHRNAPRVPQRGLVAQEGGNISREKMFSAEQFFLKAQSCVTKSENKRDYFRFMRISAAPIIPIIPSSVPVGDLGVGTVAVRVG